MRLDIYRHKARSILYMATRARAGLPGHVEPSEWKLLPAGCYAIHPDTPADIEARGFSYFSIEIG